MSSAAAITAARSLLFVPGDRPERFTKAAASGADLVVLDLEDAVAPARKATALAEVLAWLSAGHDCVVRVNAVGTDSHAAEIEALAGTGAALMLPKAESAPDVAGVVARLAGEPVIALVETALGVRDVDAIAAVDGVARLALGTVDLAAELGVDHASYPAMSYSRGRLVIASAAAGLPGPIDGVTVRLDSTTRLAEDLEVALDLGMGAKLCIHPRQVDQVNTAFAPSAEEITWARRIVEAMEAGGGGVVVVDGAMVDVPVLTRARRILDRA
jgi:citrate lyase subunit beta / citryl-CoA lyase